MPSKVSRTTVDLSGYPDLVVIYLGMRMWKLRGLFTLFSFGRKIANAVDPKPDGLLLHEPIIYSLFPLHGGMRQYWRDFQSLETWTRTLPHQAWWKEFLTDTGGTTFWHETYFVRGGMEAVYLDMKAPLGFAQFAPNEAAHGTMFSARRRLRLEGENPLPAPVAEDKSA